MNKDDFSEYLAKNINSTPPTIEVEDVIKKIKTMNKKAATIESDLPMIFIVEFAEELSFPLANVMNESLQQGVYPNLWKLETVTPAPKVYPAEKMKDLRKISGLVNFSKITDKILAEYLTLDMASSHDSSQNGNEKGLSIEPYLIKMIHITLYAVDQNTQKDAYAVIFDRQSHYLGIKSFIQNGVRPSLIPILMDFFLRVQLAL